MNENSGVGVVIGFIAIVAMCGSILDSKITSKAGNKSPPPIAVHDIAGAHQPQNRAQEPQGDSSFPSSLSTEKTPYDPYSKCDRLPEESEKECAVREIQNRTARFNGYLVGVGALQVLGLLIAIYAYFRQANIMQDQLVTENRAFMILSQLLPEDRYQEHDDKRTLFWAFTPHWTNVGAKPTSKATIYIFWASYNPEIDESRLEFGKGREGGYEQPFPAYFGPKSTTQRTSANILLDDLWPVFYGTKRIYIWGAVDYGDGFPHTERRRTEFAYELRVRVPPDKPLNRPFRLASLTRHNGADNDCSRDPAAYDAAVNEKTLGSLRRKG